MVDESSNILPVPMALNNSEIKISKSSSSFPDKVEQKRGSEQKEINQLYQYSKEREQLSSQPLISSSSGNMIHPNYGHFAQANVRDSKSSGSMGVQFYQQY